MLVGNLPITGTHSLFRQGDDQDSLLQSWDSKTEYTRRSRPNDPTEAEQNLPILVMPPSLFGGGYCAPPDHLRKGERILSGPDSILMRTPCQRVVTNKPIEDDRSCFISAAKAKTSSHAPIATNHQETHFNRCFQTRLPTPDTTVLLKRIPRRRLAS